MKQHSASRLFAFALCLFLTAGSVQAQPKPKIAVFSGPLATIHNSTPLVTGNKAREQYGLELLTNPDGSATRYDHLVPQRLAAPVEIFIEQHSAHPLERDAAYLYGPPDGYLDAAGQFHAQRQSDDDKAVYRVTLRPEDGLYLLPYMARQGDGRAWDSDCARPGVPVDQCRQRYFPDASRIFEEIDRGLAGVAENGRGNMLSSMAEFDFYRALPPGGYTRGLPASGRTDVGEGDIPPEVLGEDFFRPLVSATRYEDLARVANRVHKALNSARYSGAIWLESSTSVEETSYWLSLLIDTTIPIVGNASQRPNRELSADGPFNIVDSAIYILSDQWADDRGRNELGVVVIQAEQIFAARQIQKSDARPGGYIATGDHGGVLGTTGAPGPVQIYFTPRSRHTWRSDVRLPELPEVVNGVHRRAGRPQQLEVRIKDADGWLLGQAIPRVDFVKTGEYIQDSSHPKAQDEPDILARIERNLTNHPLAGFVAEGLAPFGLTSLSQEQALAVAAFSGMPVVRVGRGNAGGSAAQLNPRHVVITGNNLTATKARLLLIASIMKFGSLPPARDPTNPTEEERAALHEAIARYQTVFDTH